MNFYGASNHLTELLAEYKNFRNGLYPDFVTKSNPGQAPSTIPVFSFHDVTGTAFETQLDFLERNGYHTLTADEYHEHADKTKNERLVLLTFDDGYESVHDVVYPALKKRGMKAVAFVLPGETMNDATGENQGLMTWDQINKIKAVVDIQSHSLYHWIIFSAPQIACFYTPEIQSRWSAKDLPTLRKNGRDDFDRNIPLGAPFYDMDSRLSDSKRIFEPSNVRETLCEYVEKNGGADFFTQSGWRKKLTAIHEAAMATSRFSEESFEEKIEAIRACIFDSKTMIEKNLPGHTVNHFCFPFAIGGETAMEMAIEAGYNALYWGVTKPDYAKNFAGIRNVTRIKSDYIFRLPGKGRMSLLKLLGSKFIRRFGGK